MKRRWQTAVALVVAATGCTAILGVSERRVDAIEQFCGCPEVQDASPGEPECASYLGDRLALAPEEDRAAWLVAYHDKCHNCFDYRACLFLIPICARENEPCKREQECCHYQPDAGTCHDGACK